MNIYNFLFLTFFSLVSITLFSQRSIYDSESFFYDWSLTASFLSLDDDNSGTSDIINYSNWSKTLFPSKVTLCTKLDRHISGELSTGVATLNRDVPNNRFPFLHIFCDVGVRIGTNINYFKGRSRTRQSIRELGQIYLISGVGIQYMTFDDSRTFETFNLGFGFDIFVIDKFCSFNMCSLGKFSTRKNSGTNFSVHSAGLTFYRSGYLNDWINKKRRLVVPY